MHELECCGFAEFLVSQKDYCIVFCDTVLEDQAVQNFTALKRGSRRIAQACAGLPKPGVDRKPRGEGYGEGLRFQDGDPTRLSTHKGRGGLRKAKVKTISKRTVGPQLGSDPRSETT